MPKLPLIQPVILSGGAGTRLWPVSCRHFPKQFLALPVDSQYSLLQQTALRIAEKCFAPPIVLCNEVHRFVVAEHLRAIALKPSCIVLEPEGRNTAPAAAIAALLTLPEVVLLVMPSDHVILYKDCFYTAVTQAVAAVVQQGRIVTFGITPRQPETGYGYIRYGAGWRELPGVYEVEQFVEKPDLITAQQFLAEGGYLWNSGLFAFRASHYLEELDRFQPGITTACRAALQDMSRDCEFYHLSSQQFCTVPSVSIDHAIMQHTKHAAVVPVEMGWSDVGSWSTLWEIGQKDSDGNVLHGNSLAISSHRSYVHSENLFTVVFGVEDLIVIVTANACLVIPRNQSQNISNIFDKGKINFNFQNLSCLHSNYNEKNFNIKNISVQPGEKVFFKEHQYFAEYWIIIHGTARVSRGQKTFLLSTGNFTKILPGMAHTIESNVNEPLQIIDVQLYFTSS